MMTTDQRAELDAAMAKATAGPWVAKMWDSPYKIGIWAKDGADYKTCTPIATGRAKLPAKRLLDELHLIAYEREQVPIVEANIAAIVALHNNYPLLTATIDAQAAEIARLREALAAMLLTHDAGGVTLGAAKDARAALATTPHKGTDDVE